MDLIDRQDVLYQLTTCKTYYNTTYRNETVSKSEITAMINKLPSVKHNLQPNLQPTCNQLATDCISRQDALNAPLKLIYGGMEWIPVYHIEELPSVESEWNNHTVACLLADLFGDSCACNYCGIDEWLPEKCEVIDACPNPVGVACWEQFLTHRKERG